MPWRCSNVSIQSQPGVLDQLPQVRRHDQQELREAQRRQLQNLRQWPAFNQRSQMPRLWRADCSVEDPEGLPLRRMHQGYRRPGLLSERNQLRGRLLTMNTITLFKSSHKTQDLDNIWMGRWSDPKIAALFSTDTLPTPFPATTSADMVRDVIERLNPGVQIIVA